MVIETLLENDLVMHKSDRGVMLLQVETGIRYSDPIDVYPCPYTYEETDEPIDRDTQEAVGYMADAISELSEVVSAHDEAIAMTDDAVAELSEIVSEHGEEITTNSDAIAEMSEIVSGLVPTE